MLNTTYVDARASCATNVPVTLDVTVRVTGTTTPSEVDCQTRVTVVVAVAGGEVELRVIAGTFKLDGDGNVGRGLSYGEIGVLRMPTLVRLVDGLEVVSVALTLAAAVDSGVFGWMRIDGIEFPIELVTLLLLEKELDSGKLLWARSSK